MNKQRIIFRAFDASAAPAATLARQGSPIAMGAGTLPQQLPSAETAPMPAIISGHTETYQPDPTPHRTTHLGPATYTYTDTPSETPAPQPAPQPQPAPTPGPLPQADTPGDFWTLLGVTMKKLHWIAAAFLAVVLTLLTIKNLAK